MDDVNGVFSAGEIFTVIYNSGGIVVNSVSEGVEKETYFGEILAKTFDTLKSLSFTDS